MSAVLFLGIFILISINWNNYQWHTLCEKYNATLNIVYDKWDLPFVILIAAFATEVPLVIFSFVTKILIQMYSLFMEKDLMAKAIRIVKGEGLYAGKSIVIFQNKIFTFS